MLLPILPTPRKASVTVFRLKVAFYFASEGEKAKTTNKNIYLPFFPIQIKSINKKTKSYLTPKQ